jgi:hypothetical protein
VIPKSLNVFSAVWTRFKVSSEDLEELLKQGLIERGRPRSHLPNSGLYRFTAKGAQGATRASQRELSFAREPFIFGDEERDSHHLSNGNSHADQILSDYDNLDVHESFLNAPIPGESYGEEIARVVPHGCPTSAGGQVAPRSA